MNITRSLRSYFLRGLAVLLPTILTIWIFFWGYKFIHNNIGIYINKGVVRIIVVAVGDKIPVTDEQIKSYLLLSRPELADDDILLSYEMTQPETIKQVKIKKLERFWVYGWGAITGFIVALLAVCFVGILLASVVGKTLWHMIERFILNTPFLKQVYPYVKQVTDFLFTQADRKQLFSRVVAVEYPRKDIWSMGLVTGSGLTKVNETIRKDFYTVLIPTSPTPFTGFVILVPKKNAIELDIPIEEAIRFIVSGGVITPRHSTRMNNLEGGVLASE